VGCPTQWSERAGYRSRFRGFYYDNFLAADILRRMLSDIRAPPQHTYRTFATFNNLAQIDFARAFVPVVSTSSVYERRTVLVLQLSLLSTHNAATATLSR
jgi:hypothetical protein